MKAGERREGLLLYLSREMYRVLLRLYPRRFRHSYEEKLEQTFLDLCHDAVERGPMAFCGLWITLLQDLGRSLFEQYSFGGSMRRNITLVACVLVILFGYMIQAQAQFTVSAAATDPVPGWQRMMLSDENRAVWVAPTPSLTSDDILGAEPQTRPDGMRVVAIEFTPEGSQKMRELSEAQLNRPIAMLLDGELIWAPTVRSVIGPQAEITGSGPSGLTAEQIQRILDSVN